MKKMLAGVGISAAAVVGLGGAAAQASSYPPGSPGTITVHDPVCNYTDNSGTELESWSVTFDYTVTAEDAYILVINPQVDDIIASLDAPIGTHSQTITNTTPGVGGDRPLRGGIDIQLGAGDQYVTAQTAGCPIASISGPTGPTNKTNKTNKTNNSKSNKAKVTALPETGLDSTSMALGALALLGAGYTLIWAARREDVETN